ncbi:MAG: sulfite exporter TauE/SafE family protein [Formivibrio sp.]|nr:sulfite exporter TauE/SafE family protein [Formivibrio sp.]
MLELNYLALFLAGLLGGGHCAGMCGGIVTAFSLQLPPKAQRWPWHVCFNLGRILGYGLIGVLLGGMAGWIASGALDVVQQALWMATHLLLIGMGLQIAGWSVWVRHIEKLGVPLWHKIQPLLARLLPVRSLGQCIIAGALWGWLPCGLVYTASLAALSSASPVKGGALMLLFGLGTLPNLLLIAVGNELLRDFMRHARVRRTFGLILIGFGVYPLVHMAIA